LFLGLEFLEDEEEEEEAAAAAGSKAKEGKARSGGQKKMT